MVTTKITVSSIPEIETMIKKFFSPMVKIEFLENCLKNNMPNDVRRYCFSSLAELYSARLMYSSAAKNMEMAAECATNPKERIGFFMKEISLLINSGDYSLLEKPFKKALSFASEHGKAEIKNYLKLELLKKAEEFEKKNRRGNAVQIYEKLITLPIIIETEKKILLDKIAKLYSKLGKIKEAITYEKILSKPIEVQKDPDHVEVKKVKYEDLGIDFY
jgi:hypothetical protein